jgi:hypothetical protein
MAHGMTRRNFAMAASAASLAGLGFSARARAADIKTLRFIMRNDLRVLDPMWTTAYVTRNHGYMVFDTLFALDAKFRPQPQMVGDYSISPDKLVYTMPERLAKTDPYQQVIERVGSGHRPGIIHVERRNDLSRRFEPTGRAPLPDFC